jgi:hypothetical protein
MLIKVCRSPQEGEARYSPAEFDNVEEVPVMGSRSAAHLHQHRGAVQPHPAYGRPPIYPAHQEEIGRAAGIAHARSEGR